jgi:hypothetical protein
MSYLYPPRLIFSGQFQADPSTVNNDPEHFNTKTFLPSYTQPGPGATNGWWNPRGTAAWRFFDCTVQRAVYADGSSTMDPNVDPVIGAAINGPDDRAEGKLVDLDPEQQMVSEIWGFTVSLRRFVPAGLAATPMGFNGEFRVAAFADIWTRFPAGQPDSFFGAFYQSILENLKWRGDGGSRLLKELGVHEATGPAELSIKFNVDGYNDDRTSPSFTFGRVVGAIGLASASEPKHFVAARQLQPAAPWPGSPADVSVNTAYAQVRGDVLWLDLGNSLATTSAGGPLAPQQVPPGTTGVLYAAVLTSAPQPLLLAPINYQDPNWYSQTAGIVSFKLTPDQLAAVQANPLAVVQSAPPPSPTMIPVLTEATPFLRADQFVFRRDPGDTLHTKFYATNLGQPYANQPIAMHIDPSLATGQTTQGPIPGPQDVCVPPAAFPLPMSPLTTDADGTAELLVTVGDPGDPRVYIDGQLYFTTYALGATPPALGSVGNPSAALNALVFSGYKIPDRPTWLDDVQPIFQQYADLYPVMKPIVDLGNYASVMSRRAILQKVFRTPVRNPNYMPVTRDLSTAKKEMILKWLDYPQYMNLNSKHSLMKALQIAVELEHSTIPPYLCALYSIKEGQNQEAADLIRSVVVEEMLHMALSSNILISLGGHPNISHPRFVPQYPTSLPGGLRGGLTIHLRRCSIAQIRDVFLQIEEPEKTKDPERGEVDPCDPTQVSFFTIGWFYDQITKALKHLSKSGEIQFEHQDRQVKDWTGPGKLLVIGSLDDALAAIKEIKEQGEGAGPLDPDDPGHELAHYYKFSEIVHGHRLVFDRDTRTFSYTGASIPFDESGVWPMMDDPNMIQYPAGSRALVLSEQFALSYKALLNGLHRTFNGDPAYLRDAIGAMYSIDLAARELMRTPSGRNDGTTAGPAFQLTVPTYP